MNSSQAAPSRSPPLLAGVSLLGRLRCQCPGSGQRADSDEARPLGHFLRDPAKPSSEARRRRSAEGNITVSKDEHGARQEAEITPKGDLLIDGRAVAVTPAQRSAAARVPRPRRRGRHRRHAHRHAERGPGHQGRGRIAEGRVHRQHRRGRKARRSRSRQGPQRRRCSCATHLPAMLASQQKLAAVAAGVRAVRDDGRRTTSTTAAKETGAITTRTRSTAAATAGTASEAG